MIRRTLTATLVAVLALVLAACGDDGYSGPYQVVYSPRAGQIDAGQALPGIATPKPLDGRARIDVTIKDGVVQTGVSEVIVREGTRITFSVSSDRNDDMVVDKYETIEVKKGQIVQVGMNAVLTGLFSVDLTKAGVHVLNLRVIA